VKNILNSLFIDLNLHIRSEWADFPGQELKGSIDNLRRIVLHTGENRPTAITEFKRASVVNAAEWNEARRIFNEFDPESKAFQDYELLCR
jgi:hypothetical protein